MKVAQVLNGAVLYFPKGKYLTGPFNLTSNILMQLDPQATILGIQDKDVYGIIPAFPSYGVGRDGGVDNYEPLIGGYNIQNVTITGGTIDGQGAYWWTLKRNKELQHSRPALVQLQYCTQLKVISTTLLNSPFWTLHPIYCDDIYISDVKIRAPADSPNTDGIDIDSSSNVLIENVDIANGDDMIAIKSGFNMAGILFGKPTKNVIIRDSLFADGHGLSIGSETSGGIYNISFLNSIVTNAKCGPKLKTSRGRGGIIEDISFTNITVKDCLGDVTDTGMNYDKVPIPGNKTTTPILRNVTLAQIYSNCAQPGSFKCLPESPCRDFVLLDVSVPGATKDFYCEYISGSSENVQPPSCINVSKPTPPN
uniref:Pectate lyase superfamily protein domain-containing protein n=1 Tax=Arcella intermedia TaxID=1963864 RepID=A0A6B2L660_9EUKA